MTYLKTEKEIQIMHEGGKILSEILKKLSEAVKPGIATNDLEELACELISTYNAKPSFLGFENYPSALCTSLNEEIVHGVPSERKLQKGDLLKIDTGILYKGFHTDSAITILIQGGENESLKNKLLNTTREALQIGIKKAVIGNYLGDIGSAIQRFAEGRGFNVVRELVGHGIGKALHEWPQIPNYGKAGKGEKLLEGMTLAIEPMIVTGDWHIKDGQDGFSYKTKDGGLAAHFEHTIAITREDPLILTR